MFNDETCFAKVAEFLMTVHFVITQIFGNITSMNYTVIGVFWSQTYLGAKCLLLLNTKLNFTSWGNIWYFSSPNTREKKSLKFIFLDFFKAI